jgi:hypothetical protein
MKSARGAAQIHLRNSRPYHREGRKKSAYGARTKNARGAALWGFNL